MPLNKFGFRTTSQKKNDFLVLKWVSMLRLGLINDFCNLPDLEDILSNVEVCRVILNIITLGKKVPVEVVRLLIIRTHGSLRF